jgi:serine/threonine protein kinase
MHSERWSQVEQLFHEALERPAGERNRFLVEACRTDVELLTELESLFAADLTIDSPLDHLAWEAAADLLSDDNLPRLSPGMHLGPYQIEVQIGSGGMGEVYKARDLRLGRFVAIKTLTGPLRSRTENRRFLREARAISALNHPNIVTLHDIITENSVECLVMEYIAGKTLQEIIAPAGLPLTEVLPYAIQIADALAAAHAAGFIHRDIKPSNVMITNEGSVKVLDFGIAKLADATFSHSGTLEDTLHTPPGVIVGSAPYMSPEQVQCKQLDARSDIFSFGALLYEMCSGQRAFPGSARVTTLQAIHSGNPVPLHRLRPDIAPSLERAIDRCLRKRPEDRFQNATDLKLALQEVVTDIGSGPPVSRHRLLSSTIFRVTAIATLLLITIAAGLWWRTRTRPPLRPLSPERLTFDSGLTTDPAISPDGRLIAYASDRAGQGNLDIWVQYRIGDAVRITHSPADEFQPSFSPDGTQIVYHSSQDDGIYVISSLGSGEPRLITRNGASPRFSPDGTQVLFSGASRASSPFAYTVDITNPAASPKRVAPEYRLVISPLLSPDGQSILFYGTKSANEMLSVRVLSRRTGEVYPVSLELRSEFHQMTDAALDAWLPDDRILLELEIRGRMHLWLAKLHRNPWRLDHFEDITPGTGEARSPSIARDGTIVVSSEEIDLDLWSLPVEANRGRVSGPIRRLTQDAAREAYPSITPDGTRLAYSAEQSGSSHIWVMDLPGGSKRMLTSWSGFQERPVINSNGSQIAFVATDLTLLQASWIVPSSGGPARQLRGGDGLIWDWANDNQALLILKGHSPPFSVDLVDDTTGRSIPFLQRATSVWQTHVSHDGHWVVAQEPAAAGFLVAPISGNTPPAPELWKPVGLNGDLVRWSPDDNLLYFVSSRDSFRCIYAQRLDPQTKRASGQPFAVAHFHEARRSLRNIDSGRIGLAVARDQIVLAQTERSANVWTAKLDPSR